MEPVQHDRPVDGPRHDGRVVAVLGLALAFALACTGSAAPPDGPPEPAPATEPAPAAVDTAALYPPAPAGEAPVTDPAEIAVREAAAASLKLPPESIAVHRTSSRAGLSAWRAFPAGQERSPGGAMVTALVDDGEVLTGKAGFATWLERHGRADPVATAIAWYVLVERSALEPYGSWTRGARQKPDPAYDADGKLVFFHSEPLKGRVMETKLAFADDGTVTPESRPR